MITKSTVEVTSHELVSDNPVHQRQLFAYVEAKNHVHGNMLEIGCGNGRGIDEIKNSIDSYTAIDKNKHQTDMLQKMYPDAVFHNKNIPPISFIENDTFDSIISFQVIEHIQDDLSYLKEIQRILKPGGVALISTPNIKLSLSRNPWHIREYQAHELEKLAKKVFNQVEMKGVAGSKRMMDYHEENRKSVNKITRWDIFNLQYRLPASWLQVPYEILNRRNRNKLEGEVSDLVKSISCDDFHITDDAKTALDLFLIVRK